FRIARLQVLERIICSWFKLFYRYFSYSHDLSSYSHPAPPLPIRALRFPPLMPDFYPTRALAISTYSSSRSMPMYWNPSRFAATSVEPLPANGSSTIPPGGVTNRTSHAISSVGLTVGWLFARFVCIFVACSGVPLYSPYVRAGLSGKLISSPRQSLLRSRLLAFFDSSCGVMLKYFE